MCTTKYKTFVKQCFPQPGPALPFAMTGHCMVHLGHSTTLVIGGVGPDTTTLATALLYDWRAGTWCTASNTTQSYFHLLLVNHLDGL